MSRFYFHVRSNGRKTEDKRGRQYDDRGQACAHAIQLMPQLLTDAMQPKAQLVAKPFHHGNSYVIVEVADEKRPFCLVKGRIVVEKC